MKAIIWGCRSARSTGINFLKFMTFYVLQSESVCFANGATLVCTMQLALIRLIRTHCDGSNL